MPCLFFPFPSFPCPFLSRQDLPPKEAAFVTCICLITYYKRCRHFDRYVQVAGVIAQPARQQEADLVFMLGLAAFSCLGNCTHTGGCGQSKHEAEVSFLLPGRLCDHTSHLYIPVKVLAVLVVGSQANAGYKCSFPAAQVLPVLDVCCDAVDILSFPSLAFPCLPFPCLPFPSLPDVIDREKKPLSCTFTGALYTVQFRPQQMQASNSCVFREQQDNTNLGSLAAVL